MQNILRRGWRYTAVALAILVVIAVGAQQLLARGTPAAPPRQVPSRAVIYGVQPRALAHAKLLGHDNGARRLALSISLRLPNPAAVNARATAIRTPGSASYHHYLTPDSFTQQFAPSTGSVTAVRRFLEAAGLHVTGVSSNRLLIDATGTEAQVERAFATTIGTFKLGKRTFYAPERPPSVPHALGALILNIGGLDNLGLPHPQYVMGHRSTPSGKLSPQAGPAGGYTPTDLQGAYDVTLLISGGGDGYHQRVAVFELAPYTASDIQAYRSQYSLPASTISDHAVDGAVVQGDASGTIEADADIEVVSALAPAATQDVYVGPNTSQGVNDTYNAIVTDNADAVVTTSWGLCEAYSGQAELATLDSIFQQAELQGQTILAAAGDSGSDGCGLGTLGVSPTVNSPASDPYVLGVGGTSLSLGTNSTYGSESVWNDTCSGGACGGGGGLSSYFSRPAWQAGAGVSNGYAAGTREVPDLTADSDPATGYSIYCSSQVDCSGYGWIVLGGTSLAAPLWAGILSDVNTNLVNGGHAPLGWANQTLYTLFANAQNTMVIGGQTHSSLHDITSGTNDIDYSGTPFQGDYPATDCYDLTSGIGSPDAWTLASTVGDGVQTAGGGPCPAPAPASTTNLIQDGGFEATSGSPWQPFSAAGQPVIGALYPYAGAQSFQACGYPGCDDRVEQTLSVPATVHSATLSFWVMGVTTLSYATLPPPCLDHFTVTLSTPDGTVFDTVQATCNMVDFFGNYTLESFPVTAALQAHAGQQIVLSFRATAQNEASYGGFYSQWFVDNVSLNVS